MNQTLPLLVRPSWAFILITEKSKTHLDALSQVKLWPAFPHHLHLYLVRESGWVTLLEHVCLVFKSSWSTIPSGFWDDKKPNKAVGTDSRAVAIAKSAHTKFRITDDFPSARSHTRVQWLPHNRAQQILFWKQSSVSASPWHWAAARAYYWSQRFCWSAKLC